MRIIVDADATPRQVLELCKEAADLFTIEVLTVASFNHCIDSMNHITVGDGPQETDLKIINITTKDDVVVTQDFGLAAVVLSKGASAISPMGRVFRSETIGILLEERDLKARYRRMGKRTGGPAKRKEGDNALFRISLHKLIKDKGV